MKGERIRRRIAGLIWPEVREQEREIVELCARLKATHQRMQDLYWEGKAKENAQARIAGLTDGMREALTALYVVGHQDAAMALRDRYAVEWTPEEAEGKVETKALPEIAEGEGERL